MGENVIYEDHKGVFLYTVGLRNTKYILLKLLEKIFGKIM